MTDMLKSASDWLGSMFQTHASRSVVYSRGAAHTCTIDATVGRTVHEIVNNLGLLIATESRDFIVAAADIAPQGSQVEPAVKDRITDTQDGTQYIYEVMPFGKESQCFRYCDADHTYVRVHTKEVDRITS